MGYGKGAYSDATYITGLTAAVKKFQKIARAYDYKGYAELEQALYEGAQMIRASAVMKVHSRSGMLARSIVAKKFAHKKRDAPAVSCCIAGSDVLSHCIVLKRDVCAVSRNTETSAVS